MVNNLGMHPVPGNLSVYVRGEGENIEGTSGPYVDNYLNAGNNSFKSSSEQTLSLFESEPHLYDNFDTFGSQIWTTEMGKFFVGQQYYVNNLTYISENYSF